MKRLLSATARPVTSFRGLRQPCRRLLASTTAGGSSEQAIPLGKYYEIILNNPSPYPEEKPEVPPTSSTVDEKLKVTTSTPPETPKPGRGRKQKDEKPTPSGGKSKASAGTASSAPSSPPTPIPPPASAEAKARVIFGSRLLGPAEQAERLASMRERSSLVAGVLVPPRPDEPDNCCMSGCVNCVWDTYRDEMEQWAGAHAEAERRLRAQEAGASRTGPTPPSTGVGRTRHPDRPAASMDDDGGGSEANWDAVEPSSKIAKDLWDDELYRNLPVGIREFMKQEKRLKLKHEREGTVGG